MRSKLLRISVVSIIVLGAVTTAALLAMSLTKTELRAQAVEPVTGGQTLNGQPHVTAYNQHNLIRFHVIANSDSDRDQALKRKVRDLIVERMSPEFAKARDLNEARQIAKAHLEEIEQIARKEVNSWGEQYTVTAQLGKFDFPIKSYGQLTLPAGNYEAVRVVIGQGQGANWWCVLFPPLCFVDVSRAVASVNQEVVSEDLVSREVANEEVAYEEAVKEEVVNEAIVNEEIVTEEVVNDEIVNKEVVTEDIYNKEPQHIEIRFKFLEFFSWLI